MASVGCGVASAPPLVNSATGASAAVNPAALGPVKATVAAAGDIACATPESKAGCRAADTAALIGRLKPARVLALGDLAYESGSTAEFTGGYAPTWGKFKSITFPAGYSPKI